MRYQDIAVHLSGKIETRKGVPIAGTPFVVHKLQKHWRVTHQPSGLRLCCADSYAHGKTIATVVSQHFPIKWEEDTERYANKTDVIRMLDFLGGQQ